ncbi:MAG TPA: hypothetical protein VKR32_17860 [Puia sp.]|nr:hypothetical protein [Puia sp.]
MTFFATALIFGACRKSGAAAPPYGFNFVVGDTDKKSNQVDTGYFTTFAAATVGKHLFSISTLLSQNSSFQISLQLTDSILPGVQYTTGNLSRDANMQVDIGYQDAGGNVFSSNGAFLDSAMYEYIIPVPTVLEFSTITATYASGNFQATVTQSNGSTYLTIVNGRFTVPIRRQNQ